MESDFPEFDKAYDEALLPENPNRFNLIAAETRFNIFNSPIWKGTGQKFAEEIVRECVRVANKTVIGSDAVGDAIKQNFGIQ